MITADAETLMRQAWMTADEYLGRAVECIDSHLGEGYAKQHPEVIAAFIQTAATDMAGATIGKTIQDGLEALAGAVQTIADRLEG
jgi:hypothetical protein